MLVFAPASVSAAEETATGLDSSGLVTESNAALYSIRGAQASNQLTQSLASYNITVNDNTLIEIRPSNVPDSPTVLHITNAVGSQIQKAIILSIDKNGELQSFPIPNDNSTPTRDGNTGDSGRVNPFNDSLQLVFMINYNGYSDGFEQNAYVQPQVAMFIYYDDDNLYNITRLEMDYYAVGTEFTYPGLEPLGDALDICEYHITIDKSSPRPRTYHSESDPYPSNKVLLVKTSLIGAHNVYWALEGVRRSNNRSFSIFDTLYF